MVGKRIGDKEAIYMYICQLSIYLERDLIYTNKKKTKIKIRKERELDKTRAESIFLYLWL